MRMVNMKIENIKDSEDISEYLKTKVKKVALAKLEKLKYAQSLLESFFYDPDLDGSSAPVSIKRVGFDPDSSSKDLIVNDDDYYISNINDLFYIDQSRDLPTYMLMDSHHNTTTNISCERYAILVHLNVDDMPISEEDLISEGFVKHSQEEDCFILPIEPSELGYKTISSWREEYPFDSEDDRDFSIILELWNTEDTNSDHVYFSVNLTYWSSEGYAVNSVSRVTPEVREITIFS